MNTLMACNQTFHTSVIVNYYACCCNKILSLRLTTNIQGPIKVFNKDFYLNYYFIGYTFSVLCLFYCISADIRKIHRLTYALKLLFQQEQIIEVLIIICKNVIVIALRLLFQHNI